MHRKVKELTRKASSLTHKASSFFRRRRGSDRSSEVELEFALAHSSEHNPPPLSNWALDFVHRGKETYRKAIEAADNRSPDIGLTNHMPPNWKTEFLNHREPTDEACEEICRHLDIDSSCREYCMKGESYHDLYTFDSEIRAINLYNPAANMIIAKENFLISRRGKRIDHWCKCLTTTNYVSHLAEFSLALLT